MTGIRAPCASMDWLLILYNPKLGAVVESVAQERNIN